MRNLEIAGLLQKAHPMIAIGVKTRHASRAVLNQMRDTLSELKDDGRLSIWLEFYKLFHMALYLGQALSTRRSPVC